MIELDDEAVQAAIEAAESEVELDDVGDYGYGGEICEKYVVTNWPVVVRAAVTAYLTASPGPGFAPRRPAV